jgi:hypothetical protein
MAQGLAAMATPIQEVIADNIRVVEIGAASDGSPLRAPFLNGKKIVLDLTPEEDDWLAVVAANAETFALHTGETAQSMCVAVEVDAEDAEELTRIDQAIRRAWGYNTNVHRIFWKDINEGCMSGNEGTGSMLLHLVLENSVEPTPLRFVTHDVIKKGTGRAFLDECRGNVPWKDWKCKAKVLLECVQQSEDYINVTVTVLSVIFAATPKRVIVDYTADEEAAALRSAKRFKYQF